MGSERPPNLYRVNVEGGGSFLYDRIDVGRLLVRMGEAGDDRAVSIERAGEGEPDDCEWCGGKRMLLVPFASSPGRPTTTRWITCPECRAQRAGEGEADCERCDGSGRESQDDGLMLTEGDCVACGGSGSAQRAGEGEDERAATAEAALAIIDWIDQPAQRAGEPPTPDEVERATRAIKKLWGRGVLQIAPEKWWKTVARAALDAAQGER